MSLHFLMIVLITYTEISNNLYHKPILTFQIFKTMIKTKIYLFALTLTILFAGCSKDDETGSLPEIVVAFENPSLSFSSEETASEVNLVFSSPAATNGAIQVTFQTNNLIYGNDADFTTVPPAENGIIQIPVEAGDNGTSFVFNKLSPNPTEGEDEKSVEFSFGKIDFPNGISQGNTTLLVTYSESASLGGSMAPTVGGPNEPNQVYIDLSSQSETAIQRDTWDLGFYTGGEFRVKLNSSMFMFAAPLETTDIDAVSETDVDSLQKQMAFLVAGSDKFVDAPNGNLNETAIAEISVTPEENKVYLINMGSEIGTETPETGSVAISGDSRGWKKIRILRDGDGYLLQYADLNATAHQEISIPKDENFNFSFFGFESESIVTVEPPKENWDLNFTTATETLDLPSGGKTAYGFSDYVKTNGLAETKVYEVLTSEIAYADFSGEDVQAENFQVDERTIGANWRSVFENAASSDRFYVIEDAAGNIYKLKFNALADENGVRGNPAFEFSLLD